MAEPVYLWFFEDLTDPQCIGTPLARYTSGGDFVWYPGEPKPRDPLTDEWLRLLPGLTARGVRFTGHHTNVFEGRAWTAEDPRDAAIRAVMMGGIVMEHKVLDARLVSRQCVAVPIELWRALGASVKSVPGAETLRTLVRQDTERILCAAIYVDTGEAHPARRSYTYPATGLVFTGWRHGDCYTTLNAWAERLTEEERATIGEEQLCGRRQGFLTSLGRFVDREEAARIAVAAGQVNPKVTGLMSEDLY